MLALSLWQPWATLVAIGAKRIETRHWHTNYRGPLAIHAAKRKDKDSLALCVNEPFRSALAAAGYYTPFDLPFGMMLATCRLDACLPIHADGMGDAREVPLPKMPERAFGNYTPGRFAFILTNAVALSDPIPVMGRQGFFQWDMSIKAAPVTVLEPNLFERTRS